MSNDNSYPFEKENPLLFQIKMEKDNLNLEQKKIMIQFRNLVVALVFSSISFTFFAYYLSILSAIAIVFEFGVLFFICILMLQYRSLKNEIQSILSDIDDKKSLKFFNEIRYFIRSRSNRNHPFDNDRYSLNRIHDVNKNIIDKLFEKLSTFSNSWLAVSGSIASGVVIEVLSTSSFNFISAIIIISCSALLWSITQNCYGVLDYELVKKTKDLQYWWILVSMAT